MTHFRITPHDGGGFGGFVTLTVYCPGCISSACVRGNQFVGGDVIAFANGGIVIARAVIPALEGAEMIRRIVGPIFPARSYTVASESAIAEEAA